MGASQHDFLNNAQRAKADEFYTTYEAIDAELKHYRADLRDRHVICPCNDRPGKSMFVQWILDHMGEYGMASLTCTSYEAGRNTLFDDGTQARRWHVGNDGRTGAYTTEDLTAVPLDGDGSFDGPEVETLLEPGTLVLTNPPFSLATRFMRMIGRHPDVDYLIVANQNLITSNDTLPLVMAGRCVAGLTCHTGGMFFHMPDSYPRTGTGIRADGAINVPAITWLTGLKTAWADKTWTPTGRTYEGHEDEYPKYDTIDAIEVSSIRMIPDDHTGLMGVPISLFQRWRPDGEFELVGILSGGAGGYDKASPMIGGRQKYKRLLMRRRAGR